VAVSVAVTISITEPVAVRIAEPPAFVFPALRPATTGYGADGPRRLPGDRRHSVTAYLQAIQGEVTPAGHCGGQWSTHSARLAPGHRMSWVPHRRRPRPLMILPAHPPTDSPTHHR